MITLNNTNTQSNVSFVREDHQHHGYSQQGGADIEFDLLDRFEPRSAKDLVITIMPIATTMTLPSLVATYISDASLGTATAFGDSRTMSTCL